MKWLFGLLLLANLVFFAIMQWGGALTEDNKNMQPLPAINAEKIRLQTASLVVPASAPDATPVPAQAPLAAQPAHAAAASSVPSPAAAVCLEWGEFSDSDLTRASAALAALSLGDRLVQRQVEHASGFWVYIPPLKSRADVDKKIGQLKARGVVEYFVVNEAGKWQNAISLGIFKSEEAAQKFLASLGAKGVISARVGERTSKLSYTVFELKNLDAVMVDKVRGVQEEFPGSVLKMLACNT